MATGTATIDFGAFPGKSDTSIAISDAAVSDFPTSKAEAWLVPLATADHTADEHMLETIAVFAGPPAVGVGFTVYGFNTSQFNEQLTFNGSEPNPTLGGIGTRIYGTWTIAWAWV